VAQCAELRPAPVNATDRVLLAVPLFHLYGLGPGLLQVAAAGASAVLMDKFSTEGALEVCERHRVTAMVGVPPMYQAFAGVDAERLTSALASMRLLTSGAAPLPSAVLSAIRSATGLAVYEGYGLTETGPVLTSTLVGGVAKPGSVGRPIPGVELRLVDSDGRPADTRRRRPGWCRCAAPTCSAATGRTAHTAPTKRAGSAPAMSATSTPTATCTSSTGPTT
jgi:long-chain acyl-CoA synthetase